MLPRWTSAGAEVSTTRLRRDNHSAEKGHLACLVGVTLPIKLCSCCRASW